MTFKVSFDAGLLRSTRSPTEKATSSLTGALNKSTSWITSSLWSTSNASAVSSSISKYAYAFVIGGCDPEKPRYRGFVYNILVSARILQEEGSKADIVAYFQLSYKSPATELPDEDTRLLAALGVQVLYIPKSKLESFYDTVMNKFRIVSLTQYRRVLLMDGDVMPVANLDYLFELSDGENAILKENVVVSGPLEPANGGFFILAPHRGEWDLMNQIIQAREEAAKDLPGHKFDEIRGWGHAIIPPDKWVARNKHGTNWTFHFGFSDQGLLYHYTKYVKKSVSIIHYKNLVENWGASGPNGTVELELIIQDPFANYSKPRIRESDSCRKFMCDYIHFSGRGKPWLHRPPDDIIAGHPTKNGDSKHLWWNTLYELNNELDIGLNFSAWNTIGQRPLLGLYAKFNDMDARVKANTRNRTIR